MTQRPKRARKTQHKEMKARMRKAFFMTPFYPLDPFLEEAVTMVKSPLPLLNGFDSKNRTCHKVSC